MSTLNIDPDDLDLDNKDLLHELEELGYKIEDPQSNQITSTNDDDPDSDPEQLSFDDVLTALVNPQHLLTTPYLRALSDMTPPQVEQLQQHWPTIDAARRIAVLEQLLETTPLEWSVDGHTVARIALNDPLGAARSGALQILAEECSIALIPRIIDRLQHDSEARVRAAAAATLGQFMYLQELEKLPEGHAQPVENALMQAIDSDDDLNVQRRALESLGFIDRESVQTIIRRAYQHNAPEMRASALQAMARSLNSNLWHDHIVDELDSETPVIAFQAIYAAGELQLQDALPTLLTLLLSEDIELRDAAVWTLGEIGGSRAMDALQALQSAQPDNNELQELIGDALANIQIEGLLDIDDLLHWSTPH